MIIQRTLLVIAFFLSILIITVSFTPAVGKSAPRKEADMGQRTVALPSKAPAAAKIVHTPLTRVVPAQANARVVVRQISLDYTGLALPISTNWQLPQRPLRVGIQAGHWQHELAPPELAPLHGATGAISGPYTEAAAVLAIARDVQTILEHQGVQVDLLPATVPPDYHADAFVAIHADGSSSDGVSGYKVAPARRDLSGQAPALAAALDSAYGAETGMPHDPNITINMTGYYAFNYRLYQHSIDPYTPGALIETGFITSPVDRQLIVQQPQLAAQGIAEGILLFLSRA